MATEERARTDAERWYAERYAATPERPGNFTTLSAEPIRQSSFETREPSPSDVSP